MKFVKELLPAGGEELRVFLVFVLLALPVMTLLNRSLKRGRVSHRAAITFVILLFLLDAFLFYHGGKEGAVNLFRSFSAFFPTF